MRRFVQLTLAAGLSFAAALMAAGTANAGGDRTAKSCDDPAMLNRIVSKFRHQVRNVPHLPDVEIVDFRRIHQHRYLAFRDNSFPRDRPIARRYCGATALLSDGRKREVWYLIEDRMGFAGVGDGVEFCVSGFDRWKVYNGRCRVLR